MSERREYLDVDTRRERLLGAALDAVREGGAAALTLRGVAQRAGVVHAVVSYAFRTRAGLVEAFLRREAERTLGDVWSHPLPEGGSLADAVRAALTAYADEVVADPERAQAIAELTLQARTDAELAAALAAEQHTLRAAIGTRLGEWSAASGVPIAPSVDTVTAALLAAAEGLTSWWLTTRDTATLPDVVALLAGGIGSRPDTVM
ncbi:TetR/AcrR family transcriptional regulator [Protaetiibacter intestinalis]|nr:TetR/AcrR family transcriptional regulator [Protaetiibacter intestinalis]